MSAKRKPLQRLPHTKISPEVLTAYKKIKVLELQGCTCRSVIEDCPTCAAWWVQHQIIRLALQVPPYVFPCLKSPRDKRASPVATALAKTLQSALAEAA